MLFNKLFFLVCSLIMFVGCAGVTRPATTPSSDLDDEIHAKTEDDELSGDSLSGICIRTGMDTYDAVRIVHIINDTVVVIPYPFWNVESHKVHIDDIISIEIPKERRDALKGSVIGFSFGFTGIGLVGLGTSKYNEDYSAYLALSFLGGLLTGGLGCCIGGVGDVQSPSYLDFGEMTKHQKIRVLNNLIEHHQ